MRRRREALLPEERPSPLETSEGSWLMTWQGGWGSMKESVDGAAGMVEAWQRSLGLFSM